jgi:hypothetical protein
MAFGPSDGSIKLYIRLSNKIAPRVITAAGLGEQLATQPDIADF